MAKQQALEKKLVELVDRATKKDLENADAITHLTDKVQQQIQELRMLKSQNWVEENKNLKAKCNEITQENKQLKR